MKMTVYFDTNRNLILTEDEVRDIVAEEIDRDPSVIYNKIRQMGAEEIWYLLKEDVREDIYWEVFKEIVQEDYIEREIDE